MDWVVRVALALRDMLLLCESTRTIGREAILYLFTTPANWAVTEGDSSRPNQRMQEREWTESGGRAIDQLESRTSMRGDELRSLSTLDDSALQLLLSLLSLSLLLLSSL